jgi:hypothetical protein
MFGFHAVPTGGVVRPLSGDLKSASAELVDTLATLAVAELFLVRDEADAGLSDTLGALSEVEGFPPIGSFAAESSMEESAVGGVKGKRSLDEILEEVKKIPLKVTNVGGSTAGAGSGDFHQFRKYRNAEARRLGKMEAEHREQLRQEGFLNRKKEMEKEAEERTAKLAAKRKKRKMKKKNKGKKKAEEDSDSDEDSESNEDESSSKAVAKESESRKSTSRSPSPKKQKIDL